MYILGISCYYHDSSAALIKDGRVVAAAEEERFSREKHDNSFPINAIQYCLDSQGIDMNDIDHVGFYEKPLIKFERLLFQFLQTFPWSLKTFVQSIPSWMTQKLRVAKTVKKELGFKKGVMFVDHHTAHAASCFLLSPFEKAAILTIDGIGEWTTTAYGVGDGNEIKLMKDIKFPHSLGLLYSTITAYLGFKVNNSEYKVMGLAAYGNRSKKSNPYYKKILEFIDIKEDGSFRLDMSYFAFHYGERMPSKKMCHLLGGPIAGKGEDISQRHKDIAAALQMITEEVIIKILRHIHKETGQKNIVLAGGVALNSVVNGQILKKTPFKNIWIPPDPSDGGASMGAAAYIYFSILNNKREKKFNNPYLGPSYSNQEVKSFLEENNIEYYEFKNDKEKVEKTAHLIYQNKVVAWFQGAMEWGPRALGARSILAHPGDPEMKNKLNKKVKHRESFRPFAPAICQENVYEYFDCECPLPDISRYMLGAYPILDSKQKEIPSACHVNGTGRAQVVNSEDTPLYYEVIREFGKISGIPIIINTSFNVRGEPIVCTPEDAYNCFANTGIDHLVIEDFLINKDK